jgi:hypothetical protein
MRTLATGSLLTAIVLIGSPAVPHVASKGLIRTSDPIISDVRRGLLTTRETNKALLGITCARGRQQLSVYTPDNLSDIIDVRYRIDDQPQKRTEFELDSSNTVLLPGLLPAEIGYARRVSVEFIRYEGPTLLLNFRTAAANGILKAVSCRL